MHFTPTSGSWLNMVEIFFGIITRQAIRRGTFTTVNDLIAPSRPSSTAGTNAANRSSGPRPPTQILAKIKRKSTSTHTTLGESCLA